MADGRKIPYLIELAADDKKIRQQMAKINWEELLGSKGKGFGDVLVSDAKDAKDQIKRTLGGLDIDWSKILGAKEIGQLEQAVTKALSKSRKEIELFAASGDTTGLEKTIKYVSALGEELKGLGSNFDAASLARGMSAFMKVLTPLTAKFETLADEPKKVEAAFDKLFSGIATSAKSVDLGKAFDVSGKIKIAMQGLKATNDEILEATESLEKYRNVVAKLSGDNPATIKLAQDVAGLNQQLDEQMRIEEQLAAKNKTNSAQYAATLKNIMAIENARLKLKEKPTTDYTGMEIREDFGYYEEQINKVVERISKKMEEAEGKLANTVDKSFAEIISKQISDIKLSVSLSEQAEKQFINEINTFVKKVNRSPIEKVKIQIADATNVIEDKQKRAYGQNDGDDDVNTTKIVEQTEKRFDRIAQSIKDKQDQIVEQTKNWRQQMKDAMDIEFKWASDGSVTLFNAIQDYFDENQIEVTLNKNALAEQFKAAFQDAGISTSGKVGIDAKSLQSIVSSILYGTKSEQYINDTDNDIPSGVESPADEIEKSIEDVVDANRKYVSSLEDAPEQVREVIESLKGLIKYATDGDSKNAIKTRERLYAELFPNHTKTKDQSVESFGLDIVNRLSGLLESSDDDIKKVINDAILRFNPTYGFEGAKVRDDLTELKSVDKISTKKLSNFLSSLNNLFMALGLQTDDIIEIERRIAHKGIFEETLKKAKVGKSISGLRSIASNEDLTKVPTIDEIRMLISNMKDEGLDTTSAKELLEWKDALGDATDEGSLATFREQLKNFVTGVDGIYQGVKRIVKEYEATVKVVDQVSGEVHSIAVKGSGTRGGVKFDNIINASKDIERAMNDGKKVGYGTHKAYGSGRILGGSKETRSSEAKALRGTKNTYTTPKPQEDPRGYDVAYNGIPDPSIDIIATVERTINLNESKISQLNSKLTRQRKELKKLIEENAEQSILDAKQAEIDADTKVRDELKVLNKKDKLQLDSLKLQKEERDIKTRDDYTRESIQVIDSQITETQAKIDGLQAELVSVDERLASVAPTKSISFVDDEFASKAKDLNKQAGYVDIVAANKADWIENYAQNFKSEEEANKSKEIATKYKEEENAYNQILSGLNSRIASANEISEHIKVGQDLSTELSTLENELNQMQPEYDKFSEEVKTVRESYNQRIDKLTKEMNRAKKDSTKESKRQQILELESERSRAVVSIEDKYKGALTRRESVVNEIATTKSQIAINDGWIDQKKQEIDVIDANIQRLQSLKEATEDVERVKLLDSAIAKAQSERTVLSQMIGDPEEVISETKKEITSLGQFVSSVDNDISEMYDRWHKDTVDAQKDLATMREPIAKQFRAEYKATVDQIFDLGKQLEKNPADETLKVQFQNAVEYLRALELEYTKFARITKNDGVKHKSLIGEDKKEQLSGLINTYGDNTIGNAAILDRKSQIEVGLKTSNRDLEKLNEQREQQQSTLLTEIDEEEQERLDKLKSIQEKRAKVDEQIAKFGYNQARLPDDIDEKEKERIALNETKTIQALMSKAYDKRNAYRSDVTEYSREVEDLDKWRGISGPGRKIAREFPNQLVGEYKTSNHYKNITLSAKEEVGGDELAKAIQENIERRERSAIESYINNLRAESDQNIEVEVDKYRRTDEYKALDAQVQKEAAQRYEAKLQAEADRTNKELLAQYQSSDRFKQISIDTKSEVMKTGSEFSFQFTPEQWKIIEEKQRAAIKEYTDSIIYNDDTKKHTYTKYVKNEDGVEEAVKVTVDIFDDLLKTLRTKLEYAQGKFEQAQTEVESLQNAQKEVREYGHLDSDTVYNQQEVGRLREVQTLKEEATNDRNGVLRQLALLEEQKTLLGEIENLKSKGEGDKTLEPYQDKLKEINEELSKLYKKYKVDVSEEEKDSKLEAKIKVAEKKLSEKIASYETTEKAIQQRIFNKNEQRAQSKDPKESEQRILASIESYNKNIEKSQERQRQLKEKIAEATGVEKEQLQRQLESAERNERNLETRRNNQNKNLDRLRKKQTEVVSEAIGSGTPTPGGLLGIIKEAVGEASVGNVDLTKVEEILSKILAILSGNGVVGSTRSAEMDAKLARIKELEAKQQLANEQKKTVETVKQVENAKKETAATTTQRGKTLSPERDAFYESELKYQPKELIPDKAQEEAITLKKTLDEMYTKGEAETVEFMNQQVKLANLLSALRSKLGKGRAPADEWKTYVSELLGNTDNVLIGNVGKRDYKSKLKALGTEDDVQSAQQVVKAKQEEAKAEVKITEEKKKQEKITFTRKEKNELKRLKDETKDYNPDDTTGTGSEFGGFATENTLRAILEVLNKISTSGVPKSGTKSKTTTPSNTNDPIPDEASDEVDELTAKIDKLKVKFADAMKVGYLGKKDTGLKDFEKQLKKIDKALAEGKSVEKLEQMRQKAIALGDVVNTTIAGNKRKYSGTAEMGAATRQRDNMEARRVLDHADLKAVQDYNKAYSDLIAKHKQFATKGTLYDPENQKTLQNMAIQVKDLGKQLEKSVAESEQLKELVNNSGFYKGKQMSGQHMLSADETQNLEASMKSYLQSLNLGNLEHVKFDHTHQKLSATLRTSNKTVADLEVKYNKATGALYAYQKAERESLTGVPAFLNGFKKKLNSIMQYLSMTMSIHQVLAELRKGVQYVREIDLALTELKKVTDETEETYDKFLDTAAKTGARLGTTISAVTEATATFAKLGYSMEQATEMAESAIVYKNVGDNIASTEDAADSIISTMKGFRLEATESMRIVDRFNEVGNKFAITSQGIGEALRLSASALSEGGNSLDESIALITGANEVVNDPSSVGTALKTLTLRLRGSKTELQEMGEDVTDMATTTSQLQAKLLALTGGQVDIMLDANTFKNSTQILREMADAWEDMNDIQRASALELMGGKRQANVLSALIQNFDTVEKVIETSANSAGSALEENERYLDSIQGKIDQFNNAMQAMWSDTLESDLVKWFVGLGTELIKIVDAIGLIPSILAAILTYKLAIGAIKMFDLTSLGTYIGMLFTANSATEVQGLLINKTALAQKLLNSTLIQAQAARMGLTAADLAGYSVTQLLTLGVKGLAAGFKNLWIAIGPVGWAILAIVGVVTASIAIFNAINKTTEELTEELDELKKELQDVQSEIETVNSELETMEERMAELLAKDKLSFVEQEELDRLQKENNELQRKLDLLEEEKKIKQDQTAQGFVDIMKSADDDWYGYQGKMNWFEKAMTMGQSKNIYAESRDEYLEKLMADYGKILDGTATDGQIFGNDSAWYSKRIGEEMQAMVDAAGDLDYYVGDNLTDQQKEVNEWLDYVYNMQDKLAIMRNSKNAKTNAINRIFDKDENGEISDSIDGYVEALRKGDISAKTSIENIIKNNEALVEDLEASGLSADEAVDYFTSFASELEFATLEGKIAEMQNATSKMRELFSDPTFSDFDSLFDVKTGEISETAIAEYFQGTSEATRAEIAKLIKDIKDGEISVENALKQFEIFSIQSSLDIYITEVQTNFKDVFVDLEDADGLISTFEELGEAIGSAASALDTLNQAQAEMAYSGHVSIETALQLMEYTDDYGSVLQVVDGKLQLVEGAENNLIQARINAIKTSAEASLSDATNAYNKAVLATQEYKSALTTDMSAEVVAKSWEKVLAAGAGLWEGIKSLITDESWTDAYNRGYNTTLSKITGYETEYNDSGLQALAEAEADAKALMEQAQDRVELANQLTPETLESIYSSDEASGGNDTKEEVEDDRFQREMDYWENRIGANQARYEQLQNEIDLLEAKGQKADASYYEEQVQLEGQRLTLLEGQKAAALKYLATLEEGSEEWWEVANTLNGLESDIDDVTASIVDLQDAIGEIDAYKFEEFNTRLDDIASKLGTIRDLIAPDEEDWFNDQGEWTEEGVAVLGTYIQELETYKNGLAEVNEERTKYANSYTGNEDYYASLGIHSEQEYYDKVQELTEQQYDYAQSISDTEQSVVDMYESNIDAIEEYTETLIDSYNDYIDSVKEALDAERDLYDFKKNVQKQSKDIAAIERRIASLSGSTNASDVAERRKLEAQLYESRESLNDTYYDHARSSQDEALDAEQTAYEESMTKFVEGLRVSLDQATTNMDEFLMGVTSMVMYNADTVLTKYQETNLPLTDELTNPWIKAKEAVGTYSGDALALMNRWTEEGGFFAQFNTTGTKNLKSPWSAGSTAANAFKTSVDTVMKGVVSNISTNVKTASGELSKLYQQIKDTEKRASEAKVVVNPNPTPPQYPSTPSSPTPTPEPTVKLRGLMQTSREMILGSKSFVDANTETINGVKYYRDSKTGYYYKISDLNPNRKYDGGRTTGWAIPKGTWFYTKHAKGTTGTTRDEWAITDEPQFGDELVLVPGKDGNLSFMRKGTGVVPADLTQKLFELAQIPTSDLMNKNLTAIVPNITKNDFKNEFNFESLVHVDTVDSDTLPKLEKMVDKKIDDFSKALNYSLKRFAR